MDKDAIIRIIGFCILVVIAGWLCSCKQIEYVTMEKIKTVAVHDTTRVVLCEYDSIMVQDSVAWEHYKDSVDKYYELHREVRLKFVHDTVDHVREVHDTLSVEVPVEVPVEKELSAKEKTWMFFGKYFWWLVIVVIVYCIYKLYRLVTHR